MQIYLATPKETEDKFTFKKRRIGHEHSAMDFDELPSAPDRGMFLSCIIPQSYSIPH
nr:hypothetical protein [Bacteroides intestinalis]